jgi:hypothetical protein
MRTISKRVGWIVGSIIAVLLISILFVRFVMAPADARAACDKYARMRAVNERSAIDKERIYNLYYDSCFRQRGLPPEN